MTSCTCIDSTPPSDNLSSLMKSMEESAPESDSIDLPPLLSATAPPPLLLTPLNMLWQLTGKQSLGPGLNISLNNAKWTFRILLTT